MATYILAEKKEQVVAVARERRLNLLDPDVRAFTNKTAGTFRGYTITDDDVLIVRGVLSQEMMTNYGLCDARGSL